MFSFEALSYRDNEGGLRLRRSELIDERTIDFDAMGSHLPRIYARRVSRIAGGLTATLGALSMVLAAALGDGAGRLLGHEIVHVALTPILVATVLLAILVTLAVRFLAEPFAY